LSTPKLALERLNGLIVIDEIQKRPELFPVLRVLVDQARRENRARSFLILGSASRDLIQQSSESLAGRITYLELTPFTLGEAKWPKKLWLRGGFPRSYLAQDSKKSRLWRQDYITTFLERDIPQLGIQIPAPALRRFWMMVAHYNGQLLNYSELGRSLGISDMTVRKYLDILQGTFMIRQLQPWTENIAKRQVKAPKLYFRDSGIFHSLLGIRNLRELHTHPKLGASWEAFALETVLRTQGIPAEQAYFWGIHSQSELDLFIPPGAASGPERVGYEFKFSDQLNITQSMRIAKRELKLDRLILVTPGHHRHSLDEGVEARGIETFRL